LKKWIIGGRSLLNRFLSRGYPNLYDIFESIEQRRRHKHRVRGAGYQPPIAEYRLIGEDSIQSLAVRHEDVIALSALEPSAAKAHFELLLCCREGDQTAMSAVRERLKLAYDEVSAQIRVNRSLKTTISFRS